MKTIKKYRTLQSGSALKNKKELTKNFFILSYTLRKLLVQIQLKWNDVNKINSWSLLKWIGKRAKIINLFENMSQSSLWLLNTLRQNVKVS